MLLSELDQGPPLSIDLDLEDNPIMASWMICALAPLSLIDAQRLLEITSPNERLESLIEHCCAQISDLELLLSQPPKRPGD